jgi:hypothetical protein
MYKFKLLVALLVSSIGLLNGQNTKLVLDYTYFKIPQEKAFVEIYLKVDGTSLDYQFNSKDSSYQAQLQVTYLIEADSTVQAYEKFQLNSPKYRKGDLKEDLLDVKRLSLPNGEYKLTLLTKDLGNGYKTESTHDLREVSFNNQAVELSEVQLADSIKAAIEGDAFTKHGLEIYPNLNHFYKQNLREYQKRNVPIFSRFLPKFWGLSYPKLAQHLELQSLLHRLYPIQLLAYHKPEIQK